MPNLFIDIETIPTQREDIKNWIASKIEHPKQMKKVDTIAKWEVEEKPNVIEKEWLKTSLDGGFGEVISIAYAIDDSQSKIIHRKINEPEYSLLDEFYADLNSIYCVVGHNIINFDLRFLHQRCLILNMKSKLYYNFANKHDPQVVYDTMLEWSGKYNKSDYCSLEKMCLIFGIDIPIGRGSQILEWANGGEYEKIIEHNRTDLEATRKLFYRMTNF